MRRMTYLLSILVAVMFLSAGVASAVTYSDMALQVVPGQIFTFGPGGVALSDGTAGSFTIEARGDYFGKGANGNENLDFDIDGIFAVYNIWFGEGDPQIIQWDTENDDTWWVNTWTIPGADMLAITGDSSGAVEVALYHGVGYDPFDENDFVKVELTYNAVPIPGALILLGSGLLGLVGIRRKIRS